jgi:signal transduction histidine kinase
MIPTMPRQSWLPRTVAVAGVLAAAAFGASIPALLRRPPVGEAALRPLGLTPHAYALYLAVLATVLAAVYLTVAALLLRRARQRPAASASALFLITLGVVFPQTLPALTATHPALSPVTDGLEHLAVLALTWWVLTFPDGRFRPRWTRAFAGAVLVVAVLELLGLEPGGVASLAMTLTWAATLVGVAVQRYRRLDDAAAREGVRLVTAGLAIALTGLVVATVAQELLGATPGTVADLAVQAGIVLAFLLIPLTVAVAHLRHGLWGVEASVGRTVTYGLLTVAATAGYTATVAVGTAVAVDATASAAVAAGVLAVSAHPAYLRLRRLVDRLMYGDGDGAGAAIAELGTRQGDDAAAVLASVCDLLVRTLRLPYARLTVGVDELDRHVHTGSAGRLASGWPTDELPLSHLGQPVGVLVLARRDRDGPVAANDLRAHDGVARQVAVLTHSLLLTERLRDSRSYLVSAQEEERRRLRNDLHDGLGPALGAVLLKLAAAENRLADDHEAARRLVGEARTQTAAAVADVRRLVYGLRPPALDELGLVRALGAFLTDLSAPGPRVVLDVPAELPPLPAAVEVAAYRIAVEAATNVVRHAGAGRCTVSIAAAEDGLAVTVTDDGRGRGPRTDGVGTESMRERAAELGGTLDVGRGPDGGTRVHAVLPLAEHRPADGLVPR